MNPITLLLPSTGDCSFMTGEEYVIDILDTIEGMLMTNWPMMFVWLTVVFLIYYYLIIPINWIEDLTDVGFDQILNSRSNRKFDKGAYIRHIQKLKKTGNIPPVFPNGWFALMESHQLANGEVKYVAALGENFAVFRTNEGNVCILDAYCPHLGANMAIGGVVRDNCIECPFHGWKFQGSNGKCVNIPYSDKVPETAHVKKWICNEVNSFIFVWYHVENIAPTWEISPIPEIASGKWIYRGRNEFVINCHIQEIPENGCDLAHLDSVHSIAMFSGSNALLSPGKNFFSWLMSVIFKHTWYANWERDPKFNHKAVIDLVHQLKAFNKVPFVTLDVTVQQIGPSYVELLLRHTTGNMVILQTVLPEGPLRQRVIHRIYCPWYTSLIATITLFGESIMFKRDILVWNHKTYLEKPFLVKGDGKIMQYRNWYSQFYSPTSKLFSFQTETLDW